MQFKVFLIISLLIPFASLESQLPEHVFKSQPQYYEVVRKLIPHLKTDRLESFVRKFSSFPDRYPPTLENDAERWLLEEISASIQNYKAGPTSTRQIAVGNFKFIQENHIARLEGHDPELKNELVIVGAHYDTGRPGAGRWEKVPGANDNATGCAVLLEVLRLLAQFGIKLKRSLEFHFYTGNGDSNIVGSQKVMWKYKDEDKIRLVKGMLNLDQLGYKIEGPRDSIGVVDNYEFNDREGGKGRVTSVALTSFVKMLIKEYTVVEPKEVMQCSTRCASDSFHWHKAGAPVAFVTEFLEKVRGLH